MAVTREAMIDEAVRYALRRLPHWADHEHLLSFIADVHAYFRYLAAGNHGGARP